MANDLNRLAEDPLVLPHDPCMSAADPVFPVDEHSSLPPDLCVLSDARCQQAKAVFSLAESVCGLSEGVWSVTECDCHVSEVLYSPASDLCLLAKDLGEVSMDVVARTAGVDQEAEDLGPLTTNLH